MQNPPQTQVNIGELLSHAHAHWNAGQADQAEQYCQRVLAVWPGQPDALHLLGLMAHAYGNLDLAITHLRQACLSPRVPAIYLSNLAEMLRQKGQLVEAETAGRQAVALDGKLVAAWNNLGIILQEAGKFAEGLGCLEKVVGLQPDWAQAHNNLANTLRRLNRFDAAEQHYRQAIALDPDYAEGYSNLAFLLSSQGRYEQAAAAAQQAIDLNPRLADAYLNLAEVEMSRHCYAAALRSLDMLRAFAPQHPAALLAYAKALRQLEYLDEALGFAQQAVAALPAHADAHLTLAQVLQSLGQTEAALAEFAEAARLPGAVAEEALLGRATLLMEAGQREEASAAFAAVLAAFPDSVLALASRADMQTFSADNPDIAALQACVNAGESRSQSDRVKAHFALGKVYMDLKDPAQAFTHLDEGNRLHRASFDYDAKQTAAWMAGLAERFSAERYQAAARSGLDSELPVFIVGMPRSGTSLVEQILASHPQVLGAGELSALRLSLERGGNYPELFDTLDAKAARAMGEDYLKRIRPLAGDATRLVDKMPGNFIYAGMIPLLLPGARIIHTRRNPVDTCLSCYSKQFAGEQRFSYNQAELGAFYRSYQALMTHWQTILPADRFLEVDYEALVDDLPTQARRLIDFLGLPWDEACLAFHRSQRVVRTASVNQVRQPIYTSSKGRWQPYAPWLGPLLAALELTASTTEAQDTP